MSFQSISIERAEKLRSLFTNCVDEQTAKTTAAVQKVASPDGFKMYRKALAFAQSQTYGTREVDKYYITHPLRVCRFLCVEWCTPAGPRNDELVTAAVIHNAIEKKLCTEEQIAVEYSPWVGRAVELLTINRELMKQPKEKERYYDRLYGADADMQALKIMDKFDNMFALSIGQDETVRNDYLNEIERYILPLAKRHFPQYIDYMTELSQNTRQLGFYNPYAKST